MPLVNPYQNIDDHANYVKPDREIFALSSSPITQIDPYDERNLHQRIINSVNISYQTTCNLQSMSSTIRRSAITAIELSKKCNIGLISAKQTLCVTRQKGIRNAIHPVQRRYRTKQAQLRYNQLGGRHGRFYTDTFFASIKSTRQNQMAQIFANDSGYVRVFPMN